MKISLTNCLHFKGNCVPSFEINFMFNSFLWNTPGSSLVVAVQKKNNYKYIEFHEIFNFYCKLNSCVNYINLKFLMRTDIRTILLYFFSFALPHFHFFSIYTDRSEKTSTENIGFQYRSSRLIDFIVDFFLKH